MTKRKTLRWHQAFYASLKIELQEDADCLEFLREHVIGSEPVRADLLVIKKKDDRVLQKRIGRMFRTYNVVEYKSPEDYLSVDDFYKGCAYVGLYKALTGSADQIKITEMTLTLACFHYPGKLLRHLKDVRGFQIREEDAGILRIIGTFVPIQILVTKELTKEENRWISSLSNRLEEGDAARLGEHQVGLGHIVVHPIGEAHHLNMLVTAMEALIKLLITTGDDGGVHVRHSVERFVKSILFG